MNSLNTADSWNLSPGPSLPLCTQWIGEIIMLNMKTSLHSCHIGVKQNHAHLVHCTVYTLKQNHAHRVHCTVYTLIYIDSRLFSSELLAGEKKSVARKNLFKNQCYVTMVLLSLKKNLCFFKRKNWVFATNSNFLIPIFSQPVCVNLWYIKFRIFDSKEMHSLKYLRSATLVCKDIGLRKSEFVA